MGAAQIFKQSIPGVRNQEFHVAIAFRGIVYEGTGVLLLLLMLLLMHMLMKFRRVERGRWRLKNVIGDVIKRRAARALDSHQKLFEFKF